MIETNAELSDEEIAALERIAAKINAGRVDEMFDTKIVGGSKESITVQIEWTDPDLLMLRARGVFA